MVREIAEFEVRPGEEAAFEQAVREAAWLIERAPGCHGVQLHHRVEHPQLYLLVVAWDTVEDHTERFVASPDFAHWRESTGGFTAGPPQVGHVHEVDLS